MKGYLAMLITGFFLGTIGLFVKLIGSQIHFMTLNFLRIFIGFLFLLMIVPFFDKKTFSVTKNDLKEFALIGFFIALSLSLYTTSMVFTSIQSAVLINYSYPIYILFFAYIILREKITKTKILSILLAFTGLFIINPITGDGNKVGNLLALLGSLTYALLVVLMRREDKTHSIGSVVWFFGFATLFTLPFPFLFGFGGTENVIIYVLCLGVFSTGLVYLFYNYALEKIEAEFAAVIAMIMGPLVSIILAVFIINEELKLRTIIGGSVLIFAGIYLNIGIRAKDFISRKIAINRLKKM